MGFGEYISLRLHGGAPWGFSLRIGDGDTYKPFLVSQVEDGGHAFVAGVLEGDEVVSLNGEPCADLTLLQARALMETPLDSLQLLVKRYAASPNRASESQESSTSEMDSCSDTLKSTTCHISSSADRPLSRADLYICDSVEKEEKKTPTSCVGDPKECASVTRYLSPEDMVEFQVSFSDQSLAETCTSLGSAHGVEGCPSPGKTADKTYTITKSLPVRQSFSQHGVLLSSPSMLRQVEVILQQPSTTGRGIGSLGDVLGGPEVSVTQSEGDEGGVGHCPVPVGSFSISFQVPSEEGTAGDEDDSNSESGQDNRTKHRAKTARLRRRESQSEKQLKDAKSKCKRIALLLTAAPNNPNNKGVLMFKKHQQRAKKYTLVSYGTGYDNPEYSSEEDDRAKEDGQLKEALDFKIDPELKKDLLRVSQSSSLLPTLELKKGLPETEKNLENQSAMECLPDTQGKGALMFAQRRQRMDEIAAEHEDLRRQGIPVEGMKEASNMKMEQSYIQATGDNTYIDVNIHQKNSQQYNQHQEQQYYEQQHYQLQYQEQQLQQQQQYQQQQSYQQQLAVHQDQEYQQQQQQKYQQQQQFQLQQQQQYQQQQQFQQQQQYEQELYQHQQMYKQQETQQTQHYSGMNGQQQTIEIQSSHDNRTAKPFSAQNMEAPSYSGQGEQIASRDERISTPAFRSGLLDSKNRMAGKPMFTFKEAPKVSPNPALLNLLNKGGKKSGVEPCPEEDYLSLGAEACNFLQSSRLKPKVPPPVAPKPSVNPNTLPWSPQMEVSNQEIPQHSEIDVSTPSAVPTTDNAPVSQICEPVPELAPIQVIQDTLPRENTQEEGKLTPTEPVTQQPVVAQEDNCLVNPPPDNPPQGNWVPEQKLTQSTSMPCYSTQSQQPVPSHSPSQQPWVTGHPGTQHPSNNWTPQIQPSENVSQEKTNIEPVAQPPWNQIQTPQLVQPQWAQMQEPRPQEQPPTWGQPQESMEQHLKGSWPKGETPPQPPWVTQCQQKPQVQPPWAQQSQTAPQQQPPWVQPTHQQQAPQQTWPPAQLTEQNQPPWATPKPQPQEQQQPPNAWASMYPQAQPQPPWVQVPQAQPQPQPQLQAQPHPQAPLNSWATIPSQTQSQPPWSQNPAEQGQHNMNSWEAEQSQAHHPTWVQPAPPGPTPQPNWQQPPSSFPPQSQIPTWSPAQPHVQSSWAPRPQQDSLVNTQPSPKPWEARQNTPPSQTPRRINSYPNPPRDSPPVNPMATLLNPPPNSAYEMPAVRGKGADMFAKRQSRMEKFVVDSETVEANKASRPASPAVSLPNEWKYTPNVRAPPSRSYNPIQSPSYPPAAIKQPPSSGQSNKTKKKDKDQKSKPAPKPLNVIDVMKHQPYQLNASLFTFGPAVEVAKEPIAKPNSSPLNPPIENQPVSYEQIVNAQPVESSNVQYPPQMYGMPMQPIIHDNNYHQLPNSYPQVNPYHQPPSGPYQQAYPQQYQQTPTLAFQPQPGQPSNFSYQQPNLPYQPQNTSPPYLSTPSVSFPQQSPNVYGPPSFTAAAQTEPATASHPAAAPKPKYTAKSTALVWKPPGAEKE